jgi:enterochelin esterase-like enzyme
MRTRALAILLLVTGCGSGAMSHPKPPSTGAGGAGAGASGSTGAAGAMGAAGATGLAGTAGAAGAAGATGAAGAAGSAGASAAGTSGGGGTSSATDGGAGADGAPSDASPLNPGTGGEGDFMIGPAYKDAPELTASPSVPHGKLNMFNMKSSDSTIYPGLTGAYTRPVWVYVPAQYVPGTPAPFIVVQDGDNYILRLPNILDNMIAAKRLPAMIAIMANSGGGNSKGSERGLEYDTVSDKFVTWVETELLPKVSSTYSLTLTTDPNGRATLGGSSGGAAAFTMGWFRPDLYRRILTYSGTFVNQESPTDPMYPHGAWEYHEHLIADADPKPLRVYLECGQNDYNANDPETTYENFKMANMRMAAALKAKGYHYRFDYALGAQHDDAHVIDQTLPGVLEWLWQGYPIE